MKTVNQTRTAMNGYIDSKGNRYVTAKVGGETYAFLVHAPGELPSVEPHPALEAFDDEINGAGIWHYVMPAIGAPFVTRANGRRQLLRPMLIRRLPEGLELQPFVQLSPKKALAVFLQLHLATSASAEEIRAENRELGQGYRLAHVLLTEAVVPLVGHFEYVRRPWPECATIRGRWSSAPTVHASVQNVLGGVISQIGPRRYLLLERSGWDLVVELGSEDVHQAWALTPHGTFEHVVALDELDYILGPYLLVPPESKGIEREPDRVIPLAGGGAVYVVEPYGAAVGPLGWKLLDARSTVVISA